MTESEAIKILAGDILVLNLHNSPVIYKSNQAHEMAIKALEKQMSKEPTDVRYFGEAGYYIGLCPTCKSGNNSEYQYCGDCGQKLDWESKT